MVVGTVYGRENSFMGKPLAEESYEKIAESCGIYDFRAGYGFFMRDFDLSCDFSKNRARMSNFLYTCKAAEIFSESF